MRHSEHALDCQVVHTFLAATETGVQDLHFRSLQGSDWEAAAAHFLRLPAGERVIRFGGAVSESFIHGYCDRARTTGRIAFGHVDGERIWGLAELLLPASSDAQNAEIAISAEPSSAADGVRGQLLLMVLEAACDHLIREIVVQVHSEEHWLPSLARSLGARPDLERESMILPVGLALARLRAHRCSATAYNFHIATESPSVVGQ